MKHIKWCRARDSRGEATVEFALVAVMLLLVTFGIVEGGRIFGNWLIITNEAREAARWGAVRVPDRATLGDVQALVRQRTQGLLDQSQLAPSATLALDDSGSQRLEIRIDYNVDLLAPPMFQALMFLPNPFPLSASSAMRTENAGAGGG